MLIPIWVCLGISIQSLRTAGLLLIGFSLLAEAFVLFVTRLNTLLRQHVLDCTIVAAPSFTMHDGMILTIVRALLVLTPL
ncbi:hypothetical protein [Candidatus Nitrotoga sp. AM1P]|uniref:hypothetical protein n=1 Tax=Candidatus Nitrotoga sp. AM1P TaxID=2559597 RepID=UPI0015634445|nr:hypothetical protein [Candidatus Nitrotoga sp. AM1P]